MKKFLAMILALVLAFSMSTVAFAANPIESVTGGSNSDNSPVTVTVTDSEVVYNVSVTWGAMDFTYNMTPGAWDPDTHSYKAENVLGWVATGNQEAVIESGVVTGLKTNITAANHSNAQVKVSASRQVDASVDGVSVALTGDPDVLENAALHAPAVYANADVATFELRVTGTPTAATVGAITVATITVTITAVTP